MITSLDIINKALYGFVMCVYIFRGSGSIYKNDAALPIKKPLQLDVTVYWS